MYKNYTKVATQPMTEWVEGFDMTGVSVSVSDKENGSPKKGDMIAINPKEEEDKWLVAKDFFEANYAAAAKEPTTFIDRLEKEYNELKEKATKLNVFIESDAFGKIDPLQSDLLRAQVNAMASYLMILNIRIKLLNTK